MMIESAEDYSQNCYVYVGTYLESAKCVSWWVVSRHACWAARLHGLECCCQEANDNNRRSGLYANGLIQTTSSARLFPRSDSSQREKQQAPNRIHNTTTLECCDRCHAVDQPHQFFFRSMRWASFRWSCLVVWGHSGLQFFLIIGAIFSVHRIILRLQCSLSINLPSPVEPLKLHFSRMQIANKLAVSFSMSVPDVFQTPRR